MVKADLVEIIARESGITKVSAEVAVDSIIEALKAAAGESIQLMIGAGALFLIAAFFEAFWSPLPLAPAIKYPVAALLWGSVLYYLAMVGRSADGD